MLQACAVDGVALQFVDPALRAERSVVLQAVESYGPALEFAEHEPAPVTNEKRVQLKACEKTFRHRFALLSVCS